MPHYLTSNVCISLFLFQAVLQNQTSCMNNCMLITSVNSRKTRLVDSLEMHHLYSAETSVSRLVLQGSTRSTRTVLLLIEREGDRARPQFFHVPPRNYTLKFDNVLSPPTMKWDLRP